MRRGRTPHGGDAGGPRLRGRAGVAPRDARVLNVDIGGGTTKLTLIEAGRVVRTAAFHVGGRLVAERDGTVRGSNPAGSGTPRRRSPGNSWLGGPVDRAALDAVADVMADAVIAARRGEAG